MEVRLESELKTEPKPKRKLKPKPRPELEPTQKSHLLPWSVVIPPRCACFQPPYHLTLADPLTSLPTHHTYSWRFEFEPKVAAYPIQARFYVFPYPKTTLL